MRQRLNTWLGRPSGELDRLRAQVGGLEARVLRDNDFENLQDAEFRVFSQWGEDGIIQHLLHRVPVPAVARRFVEFGVEDYRESNTRFLLVNNNWAGLVLDGDDRHLRFIDESGLRWRHQIDAQQLFITRDNIFDALRGAGFDEFLGLLSVDLDGNDYWIWEALADVKACIVVVEYNSVFGPTATVSVPYTPDFQRSVAHHSNLYFGASLAALVHLGDSIGYRFVGSNSAGNDAFFVREDLAGDLPALTAAQGWVRSRFRQSRDVDGQLTYVGGHDHQRALISHLALVDVVTGSRCTVGDLS